MKASIRIFPDPILRKKTTRVQSFDRSLLKIVVLLTRTMKRQPHGIGMAAPQLGISKSVAVVDVSKRIPGASRMVLVNPVILEKRDPEICKEGCMSFPHYMAYLNRHRWVRFRYQNEKGIWHEKTSVGIEAVCVEHEVDHLNGIFIDHVVCLKTDLIPRPR